MAQWYLSRNGQPKRTFSDWGFVNLKRKLVSQGVDIVSFDAQGALIDAAPIFDFEDKIVIYKDSARWFSGCVSKLPVHGGATEESQSFEVSGPWYYIENQIFVQTCISWIASANSLVPAISPAWYASGDKTAVEGDSYIAVGGASTVFPSVLFHDPNLINQTGGILIRSTDGAIFAYAHTSHVFLNSWAKNAYGSIQPIAYYAFGIAFTTGVSLDTGQQITQALLNSIDAMTAVLGAPAFSIGAVLIPDPATVIASQAASEPYWRSSTIDPAVPATQSEQRDMTVAEVIRNQLRWSPDAVTWFDYSQNPPVLHISQRSGMAAVSLPNYGGSVAKLTPVGGSATTQTIPVVNGYNVSNVSINPRYDIQPPFVRFTYEQTNQVGGSKRTVRLVDQYPTDAPVYGFGAIISTVDLRGMTTGAYSDVSASTIPAMTDGLLVTSGAAFNWWTSRDEFPILQAGDVIVDSIVLNARAPVDDSGNPLSPSQVPYELLSGQIADWMGGTSCKEQITATLYYHTKNGQQFVKPLQTTITSSSVNSGVYYNQGQVQYGEPFPFGLAETLYNSVSALQYDGQLTISEDECTGIVRMGQTLNLSPDWESMNAMVVQVDEDVDSGTTQVSFGPQKNLGASDLVELVRVIRNRLITWNFSDSYGGSQSSSVGIGNKQSRAQADHTSSQPVVIAISQVGDPDAAKAANPLDPTVVKGSFDAVTGRILLSGRDAQSGLPIGDGMLNLQLPDLVNNHGLN